MKKKDIGIVIVALVASCSGISQAGVIINIHAENNIQTNPVTQWFEAGTYNITPIGVADGGAYNGWNAWNWGQVNLPNVGWMNRYYYNSDEFDEVMVDSGLKYRTALQALEDAQSSSFTLSSSGNVDFYVRDGVNVAWDNVGGMSLLIGAPSNIVPVPGALLLAGIGSGLVGYMRKRRSL